MHTVSFFAIPSNSLTLTILQKQECAQFEKPVTIKTHLRGMIVVPEMSHSVVGVYNGKTFNAVEIKVSCSGLPRPIPSKRTPTSLACACSYVPRHICRGASKDLRNVDHI